MSSGTVQREISAVGEVTLTAGRCTVVFRRVSPDALLVTISGYDAGQFGASTLDEIRMELLRNRPIDILIDARDAVGAAVRVSEEWKQFFSLNREHLRRVRVLVASKIVQLTVAIAQHLCPCRQACSPNIEGYRHPLFIAERTAMAKKTVENTTEAQRPRPHGERRDSLLSKLATTDR